MRKLTRSTASETPNAQPNRSNVFASLSARYPQTQYAFVQFISEHLADCSRTFQGDLGAVVILAVIGQTHIQAYIGGPRDADNQPHYGIHALRLADVTGMPRETVRRKLRKLEKMGWVVHGAPGWRLAAAEPQTVQAKLDLAELDRRGLERLARLYLDIMRVLEGPEHSA